MDENKQALMKIFSSVLRERAKSETEYREISPEMLKFFSRKDLIEIITHKIHNGVIPEEMNLVEMENEDLLRIIGDDMYIISYVTEKWSETSESLPTRPEHPFLKAQRERKEKLAQKRAEKKASEKKASAGSAEKKEDKEGKKESASDPSKTKV